jgi:hypothetical protein
MDQATRDRVVALLTALDGIPQRLAQDDEVIAGYEDRSADYGESNAVEGMLVELRGLVLS